MGEFIGQLKKDSGFNRVFEEKTKLDEIKTKNQTFFKFENNYENSTVFIDNPDYKLDSDGWFSIDYSQCEDSIKESIKNYFDVFEDIGNIADLTKSNLSNLDFLLYAKKKNKHWQINLQTITSKYFIKSKSFLQFRGANDTLEYKNEENALEFQDIVNIHICQKDKKIYFKRMSDLRKINDDFVNLYKEASSTEVKGFVKQINANKLFIMSEGISPESTNLKKLKFLIDDGQIDEFFKKSKKIIEYIKKYTIKLTKEKDQYLIKNNADVSLLMKIFYENFYQGEITGELKENNSNKKIKK